MTNQRLQLIGFFTILGLLALTAVLMWLPFAKLFILSVILTVLFRPLFKRIAASTGNEILATWATIIIVLFIIMVPLYLIGQLAFNELVNVYNQIKSGGITFDKTAFIQSMPGQFRAVTESLVADLNQKVTGLASGAFAGLTNVVSNVANFFFTFFLVFFSLYYLLRDGDKIKKYLNTVLPLSEAHENLLVKKLEQAVNGVIKGMFVIALVQGIVATIGFLIFRVPNPFLWGGLTVLAALVPTVGTSLSLVPAVLYLLITGHTGAAIGLAIWGALAVGLIDNIISPRVVGGNVQMHPLLVLFSVIGGLQLFGIFGFLLGPIIAAMFVALLDIYRSDLKERMAK